MIDALRVTKGMVYLAAEKMGCEADTIYNRAKRSASVAKAMLRETERGLDLAELQLIKQINEGNTTALIFYLKTKGKRRGYIERHEFDVRLTPEQAAILSRIGVSAGDVLEQFVQEVQRADAE